LSTQIWLRPPKHFGCAVESPPVSHRNSVLHLDLMVPHVIPGRHTSATVGIASQWGGLVVKLQHCVFRSQNTLEVPHLVCAWADPSAQIVATKRANSPPFLVATIATPPNHDCRSATNERAALCALQ
jgi:hypothetical protein